jgi:hypothetical protein
LFFPPPNPCLNIDQLHNANFLSVLKGTMGGKKEAVVSGSSVNKNGTCPFVNMV